MRRQTIVMSAAVALGLALLGAGCRSKPPASDAPASPAAPTVNVPQQPPITPDPLADDLDAAIEDLNAIE